MEQYLKKTNFIQIMKLIKDQHDHDIKCSEAFKTILPHDFISNYDNHYLMDALLLLLKSIYNDTGQWIEYYIYDKDFGRNTKLKVWDEDDKEIPLTTFEDLYNMLIKNK